MSRRVSELAVEELRDWQVRIDSRCMALDDQLVGARYRARSTRSERGGSLGLRSVSRVRWRLLETRRAGPGFTQPKHDRRSSERTLKPRTSPFIMNVKTTLSALTPLRLALAAGCVALLAGCAVTPMGPAYDYPVAVEPGWVDVAPAPYYGAVPYYESVPVSPYSGGIWIGGSWNDDHGHRRWLPGRWAPPHSGQGHSRPGRDHHRGSRLEGPRGDRADSDRGRDGRDGPHWNRGRAGGPRVDGRRGGGEDRPNWEARRGRSDGRDGSFGRSGRADRGGDGARSVAPRIGAPPAAPARGDRGGPHAGESRSGRSSDRSGR